MAMLTVRLTGLTEHLQLEAGKNPRDDAYYAGYISAVKDLLNISLEEIEET